MVKVERLTVGRMKQLLEEYKVPDDAIIACASDEECNRTMVCMDMYIEKAGEEEIVRDGYGITRFIVGADVLGLTEDDKGKVFITFRPMY